MKNLTFAKIAWDDYCFWQENDKKVLKKLNNLLKEISRNPFKGEGKPEPLLYDKSGKWSRQLTHKDRIVYSVSDNSIIIYQCRGHYDDK